MSFAATADDAGPTFGRRLIELAVQPWLPA